MKTELIKTIVCPTCASGFKIRIKRARKNEIEEGQLICTKCGEKFKISSGIPRFVIGVTIVALGTSLPEIISSVIAVMRGTSEIVILSRFLFFCKELLIL